MSFAMVYLKPQPLLFYRVRGDRHAAKTEAWDGVQAWLKQSTGSETMARAYGLWQPDADQFQTGTYDACIEVPECIDSAALSTIRQQTSPGGAFQRTRFKGPCSDLHEAVEDAAKTFKSGGGLILDPGRAIVEIFFGEEISIDQDDVKIDICIPVKFG